jgi:ribosomal protein S7
VEIPDIRQESLLFCWLIEAAKSGKGNAMRKGVDHDIMDVYNNPGNEMKTKSQMHRMTHASRAFAYFVWETFEL